jgi:hypothetical protein
LKFDVAHCVGALNQLWRVGTDMGAPKVLLGSRLCWLHIKVAGVNPKCNRRINSAIRRRIKNVGKEALNKTNFLVTESSLIYSDVNIAEFSFGSMASRMYVAVRSIWNRPKRSRSLYVIRSCPLHRDQMESKANRLINGSTVSLYLDRSARSMFVRRLPILLGGGV